MAYVRVKRGKPVMYQAGEREWVCQGLGQVATGTTQRGAYTRWKNQVALAELPSTDADRLRSSAAKQSGTMGVLFPPKTSTVKQSRARGVLFPGGA